MTSQSGGGGGGIANPMTQANSLITSTAGGAPVEATSAAGQSLITDPTSGVAAFVAGGRRRLFHSVLGANALSFTISSIPAGWARLIIEVVGRIDIGTGNPMQLRFNGDSGSNYSSVWTENGAAASLSGTTSIRVGTLPAAGDLASVAGNVRIEVPLYDGTTFQKTGLFEYGRFVSAPTYLVGAGTYFWLSTAAVTSVTLLAGGNNFLTGTVCNVYLEL